jgi:hypothetical protein
MISDAHERQQQAFDEARIERSAFARGWIISMPDGSNAGPFKTETAAWSWIDRQTTRRHGGSTMSGNPLHLALTKEEKQ